MCESMKQVNYCARRMDNIVKWFNFVILALFSLCYSYQMIYIAVSIFCKKKEFKATKKCRYAVVIAARNEQNVIGHLINSIKAQDYAKGLVDIYVVADNCTDDTAGVARKMGAYVFERYNKRLVGKGYALDFVFKEILKSSESYDGFFIFDADNLLEKNYITEMNKVFTNNFRVVTSYRNAKNYSDSWVSAGYALYFLRDCRFSNGARMILNTGSSVTGTGYLIHSDIIKEKKGWNHFLLTEDVEFTVDCALKGEKVGYCPYAVFYDEQPTSFPQSWTQRLRWVKGGYQVLLKYSGKLIKKSFKSFYCFDVLMSLLPMVLVNLILIVANLVFLIIALFGIKQYPGLAVTTLIAVAQTVIVFFFTLFFIGIMTTITEWKNIRASKKSKLIYILTFPFFVLTYMPIAFVAAFTKVSWQPIEHSSTKSIEEIEKAS